jgi:hypothetical protein
MIETTRAYIAGFFDGEGCVNAHFSGGGPRLHLTFAQQRLAVLYYIQREFARVGIPSSIMTRPGSKSNRPQSRLSVHGAVNISLVLKLMLPYLVVKRVEAEAGIELASLIGRRGQRPTHDNLERRSQLLATIRERR